MGTIAAVLLAAGSSRRFGPANKLLADVGGEALVRRVVRALVASRAGPIVVVTGHEAKAVEASIDGLGCHTVFNPEHAEGMGSSVATGMRKLAEIAPTAAGALVVLSDMPNVDSHLLDCLIEAFLAEGGQRITFPVDGVGRQRNPVLWPRDYWPALMRLTGDKGGRDLIASAGARCHGVPVDVAAAGLDIDTPDALAAWRAEQVAKTEQRGPSGKGDP